MSVSGIVRCGLVSVLLTACAGNPAATLAPAEERLIPRIDADGSKFFVLEREPRASTSRPGARPPAPGALEARVEQVMEATGYCREGFFERFRERVAGVERYRGECREEASAADRERFVSGQVIQL